MSSEWVVLNTKYQKRVEYDEMGIPFYEMAFIYRNFSNDSATVTDTYVNMQCQRNFKIDVIS